MLQKEVELLRAKVRLVSGEDPDATLTMGMDTRKRNDAVMSFEGIQEGIIDFGPDGRAKYANRIMRDLLGMSEAEIVGKLPVELDVFPWAPGLFEALTLEASKNNQTAAFDARCEDDIELRQSTCWSFEAHPTAGDGVHILARDISAVTRMREHFEKHVGTRVLDKIMESGITDVASRQDVTMLFADLRGFTSLSVTMSPEEVRSFINDFLGVAMDVVDRWEGSVDKIVGDEVMALFGAPLTQADDPYRAVLCAVEMQIAHRELQAQYAAQNKNMPDLGIGINTGPVVVGHIGSGRRVDYTVIGHHVNLAARLCSAAKGGQVLVSDGTVDAIGEFTRNYPEAEMPKVRLRKSDEIVAKGISDPVKVYEAL